MTEQKTSDEDKYICNCDKLVADLYRKLYLKDMQLQSTSNQMSKKIEQMHQQVAELRYNNSKLSDENAFYIEEVSKLDTLVKKFDIKESILVGRHLSIDQLVSTVQTLIKLITNYNNAIKKKMDNSNLCRICMHPYTKGQNSPRVKHAILPCGHVICKDCLFGYYQDDMYRCPYCNGPAEDTNIVMD